MSARLYLFIGGPSDGENIMLNGAPFTHNVMVLDKPTFSFKAESMMERAVTKFTYRLEKFRCGEEFVFFYVPESWSSERAMFTLFEGYRRP